MKVQHREVQKHDQPLNEKEMAQWDAMAEEEERDRMARSREAMIIDGEQRHLIGVDEQGIPVEQTTVQTTTLISTEHQVPAEESVKEEEEIQREPSQGSGGKKRNTV